MSKNCSLEIDRISCHALRWIDLKIIGSLGGISYQLTPNGIIFSIWKWLPKYRKLQLTQKPDKISMQCQWHTEIFHQFRNIEMLHSESWSLWDDRVRSTRQNGLNRNVADTHELHNVHLCSSGQLQTFSYTRRSYQLGVLYCWPKPFDNRSYEIAAQKTGK